MKQNNSVQNAFITASADSKNRVRFDLFLQGSTNMTQQEKRHNDRNLLLEVLRHRVEGSLHPQMNALNVAYSLGFEKDYAIELIHYLRVNGLIELDNESFKARLTSAGLRKPDSSDLAA